jgi:membrane protease YdiL (CAAX protease family)
MRRGASLLVVALFAAVVWLAAGDLQLAARAWMVVLVAVVPPTAIVQARLLETVELPPRAALYVQSAVSLWALLALTVIVARLSGVSSTQLGLVGLPLELLLAWTGALTLAGAGLMLAAHRLGVRESRTLAALLPRTAGERASFAGLSITAGICEEIVFRGFLIFALARAVDSAPVAALIAAAIFGLVHAYQGFAGSLRAATLGVLLSLPLLVSGTIVPAILAHTAIDLIGGFWIGPRLIDHDDRA